MSQSEKPSLPPSLPHGLPRKLFDREWLREDDEDKLGRMFLVWCLDRMNARIRERLPPDQKAGPLLIVKGSTGNAALDRSYQLALRGDYAGAGRDLKALLVGVCVEAILLDEVKTGRRRQRRRGQQPRPSSLRAVITEIVEQNRLISAKELLVELGKRRGGGVVRAVSGLDVEWRDKNGKPKSTSFEALEVLLSKVKKKFL
jgi:hypothetical protein